MCFIDSLNRKRKQRQIEFENSYVSEDTQESTRSNIFSNCFQVLPLVEQNQEVQENVSTIVESNFQEIIEEKLEINFNENKDILLEIKSNLDKITQDIQQVTEKTNSEVLKNYEYELKNLKESFDLFLNTNSCIVQETKVEIIEKTPKTIFIENLNYSIKSLTENKSEIEKISSKLKKMKDDNIFGYCTPVEISEKIKNLSKRLYGIYENIHINLSTNMKNECLELLKFGTSTIEVDQFQTKLNNFQNSLNQYITKLSESLNNYIVENEYN